MLVAGAKEVYPLLTGMQNGTATLESNRLAS